MFATVMHDGSRPLGFAVVVAAVLQVVAPAVTINGPGASPGGGSGAELLITPVGWAFSIWGVIYALAIVHAVVVLARGADNVPRRLQIDQLILYLGAALWIVMAGLDSSVATAVTLLLMFAVAVDGVLTAAHSPTARSRLTVLTRAAIGLYAGWVTAAFFLNFSTALVALGIASSGDLPWQLVVLIAAVLTLLALTVATRGILTYAAAGCWALTGIAVTAVSQGTTAVSVFAIAAVVVLIVVTEVVRRPRLPFGIRQTRNAS